MDERRKFGDSPIAESLQSQDAVATSSETAGERMHRLARQPFPLCRSMTTIDVPERNMTYARVDGRGEPQLGRRGLRRTISGQNDQAVAQMALLWALNVADSRYSLLDMAERSGLAFDQLAIAADAAIGGVSRTPQSGAAESASTVPGRS